MQEGTSLVENKNLDEVSFIRPILIILLVFYHAFIIYDNGWHEPTGFCPNDAYKWMDRLSYSFMLPLFCFISGYVWRFQHTYKGRESFKTLLVKKTKRLLIPSILFSSLYAMFIDPGTFVNNGISIHSLHFSFAIGHLWFLPMLFWCFIIVYFLSLLNISDGLKTLIIILSGFLFVPNVPFQTLQLSQTMQYLQYFWGGYLIYSYEGAIRHYVTRTNILIAWMLFFIMFVLMYVIRDRVLLGVNIHYPFNNISDWGLSVVNNFSWYLHSWLGIAAMMLSAVLWCNNHSLSNQYIKLGGYCFGVYIFQQFILQYLYYYTSLPLITGLWLPWVGFVLALLVSFALTYIFKLTKIGKQIL